MADLFLFISFLIIIIFAYLNYFNTIILYIIFFAIYKYKKEIIYI